MKVILALKNAINVNVKKDGINKYNIEKNPINTVRLNNNPDFDTPKQL